jgi:hypothetical protein
VRRILLVDHRSLRVASHATDGVYSVRQFKTASQAREYLGRFEQNSQSMDRLRRLVKEFDEGRSHRKDDEEEELDDEALLDEVARRVHDHKVVVAERIERFTPPTLLDEANDAAPANVEPASTPPEKKTTFIEFLVVDNDTGQPYSPVRLVVKQPDGTEVYKTTDSNGLTRIDDLDPGVCQVWCEIKNLKMADTLAFVSMGEAAVDKSPTGDKPGVGSTLRIANIEEHKVKTNESIASLAKGAGMAWQDLAKFNWGTEVPDEINKHLRDDVGCTHKTKDGYNYMFNDSDDPGIVYIPTQWKETDLATGERHVIRARRIPLPGLDLIIPLEIDLDDDPSVQDEIRLKDGDGRYERVVASGDSDVEADVAVKVAGEWNEILHDLQVTRTTVRYGGESFEASTSGEQFGTPLDDVDVDPADISDEPDCCDL